LVDPELLPILEQLPSFALNETTLAQVRSMPLDLAAEAVPDVRCVERRVPGPPDAPDVRVLVYTPLNTPGPLPGLLHVHGGGYVMGNPEMSDARNRVLARQIGCVIVSVDYRLAPETPFPGGIEDCYAALKWLDLHATELNVDTNRLAVTGESAGGGLAASLALLARDRDEIPLCFQQLIFPMIDDRTGSVGEPHPYAGEFVFSAASNRFGWSALLGVAPGSTNGISPYAAAARAENLAGLAPAFIAVGALDLFIEENMEYARRLMRAGVPTELHVYPGAFHGYLLAPQARITQNADRDAEHALRRAFQSP
jgi:acetyl esterase/lipase